MNNYSFKIIVTGIFFIVMIVSGIWLSKLGRPLNNGVFTIHKLISLLTIVFSVITVYQLQKNIELRNIDVVFIIITGIAFLVSFVSGALLSFDNLVNKFILTFHKTSPVLLVISIAILIYLLTIRS
ncbi:MAG: hypothetical protein JXB17_00115 [Bacteroidales bacterium]|nr:hypothetical protein [Bacteroidales bacterium]